MVFDKYMSGYYDIEGQLPEYIRKKAEEFFEIEDDEKRRIHTLEEFEKRRDRIRSFFLEAIGGLDMEKTPLDPVCTGVVDKEAYLIKKVIYQSQPGVYVTANLYVPKGLKGKAPAVLFACGHFENAKSAHEYQKVCIDLANNGFIVLITDPVGQGERMQYYEPAAERPLVNWGVTEHTYAGLQCVLSGSNIARYFIWDLVRSVDYLCTLPEVDKMKIGVTGNSGGGCQTAYMMLVDDRIAAAVPCTWITSRSEYIKTGQSQDSEQIIYGTMAEGLEYDDYLTCFAPKPVMIGAVDSDFFCMEGTVRSYERARRIYGMYGYKENIKLSITPGIHSFNDEMRQEAVNWFIEQLQNRKGAFETRRDIACEKDEELMCTGTGQVLAEFENVRSVFDLNAEYFKNNKYTVHNDRDRMKKDVGEVLDIQEARKEIYPRFISEILKDGIRHKNVFFFSEEDIIVDGVYLEKLDEKSDNCTILLFDEGTDNYWQELDTIRRFLKQGDVFVFDPRGIGAARCRDIKGGAMFGLFGTEYKLNCDASMMKKNTAGMRVYDILRACDFIEQFKPGIKKGLAGRGISAIYALLAGVLNDEIEDLYLENMISSFENIVTTKYYKYDSRYHIHGILKKFDIPELLEVFKDKRIVLLDTPDVGAARVRGF